ncbi:EpsG-like putative glucosyltransferase [Kushneria sinocarnis]|uniref:EpsG-like putative glucosyltransferase n=1 Tax=Kushneria sinocarnis TaxID=595502 RepID=A0A420WY12_9GAMM|nr:EpsG family protein [Kushneria sinocarnis]RKR06051.1 EpsG-like putative glucosyltransferase [Kushneria sinocarnis]
MNWELYFYIIMVGLTLGYTFLNKKKYLVVLSFIMSSVLLWLVRMAGLDYDMNTYASALHYEYVFSLENMYFIREFLYWSGASYIFQWVQDEQLTFWTIDLIWLALLHIALGRTHNNINMPLYAIPFMVIFFPSLMGYENIYRQLIASMFVIYAFFGTRSVYGAAVVGILALFIHNASIVYAPLIYIYSATKNFSIPKVRVSHKLIFGLVYLMEIGGVYYASLGDSALSKSSSSTGLSLSFAYGILFIAMFFLALYLSHFQLVKFVKRHFYIVYALFTFMLFVPVLGPAQAERIGMMLLVLVTPLFIAELDRSFREDNSRIIIRMLFVMVGAAPTFLFGSAFNFLLTSQG